MIEIISALLLGILVGIISGLIPGLHVNIISALIISYSVITLTHFSPLPISVFIIALSITYTFTDAIPSIFLGAPDSDQALSVQPGHRLLLKGKGFEALYLTIMGSLFAVISIILISPLLFLTVNKFYNFIKEFIVIILVISSLILILKEKNSKIIALLIFLLSGTLGMITTTSKIQQPLLPLLAGLFGISSIIFSLFKKTKIPMQKISYPKLKRKEIVTPLSLGLFSSLLIGFIPALSSSQAATLSSSIKDLKIKPFLILMGSINTFFMLISFVALYTINKARSGSVVAIEHILENITFNHIIFFFSISLITAGLAAIVTINLGKIFTKIINKINYKILLMIVILMMLILTIIINGFTSILILLTATFIGLIPHLTNIRKIHLMGSLIIPTIIFLL